MKYKILAVFIVFVVLPNIAFAVTPVTNQTQVNNAAILQLITSLLEQIKVLQQQLKELQSSSQKSPLKVEQINRSDYQKGVEPLMDELERVQEEIKNLEEKIEQKSCGRSYRANIKGEIVFRCLGDENKNSESREVLRLKEDLADLEEKEADLMKEIDRLKTRYGI